jgi:hypothetical protein
MAGILSDKLRAFQCHKYDQSLERAGGFDPIEIAPQFLN